MPENKSKRPSSATPLLGPIRSSSAPLERIRPADPPTILAADADGRRYCGIPYEDRYFYFDTLCFQSKTLLGAQDQWWLEAHCDDLRIRWDGELIYDERKRRWRTIHIHWPYRIQIEAQVPDDQALAFLADLTRNRDRRLTAVHLARDFTFDHRRDDKRAMLEFINEHWVQPYQPKNRGAPRFDNGGGSTGRRSRGHYATWYADEHCRIDGITECFHMEDRIHGKAAQKRIKIETPYDLLDFDHQGFWQKRDQQSLRRIDAQRLGQYHLNRRRRLRNRPSRYRDCRIGQILLRKFALDEEGNVCTQKFVQKYGRGPFLRKASELGLSDQISQACCIDI